LNIVRNSKEERTIEYSSWDGFDVDLLSDGDSVAYCCRPYISDELLFAHYPPYYRAEDKVVHSEMTGGKKDTTLGINAAKKNARRWYLSYSRNDLPNSTHKGAIVAGVCCHTHGPLMLSLIKYATKYIWKCSDVTELRQSEPPQKAPDHMGSVDS
jgi:hypothetical protein